MVDPVQASHHPGSKAANKPLFFLPSADKNAPGRDPDANRKVICPDGWAATYGNPDATTVPEIQSTDKASCDEFAYASTYNSGGMPGGTNEVDTGNDCVQTYATESRRVNGTCTTTSPGRVLMDGEVRPLSHVGMDQLHLDGRSFQRRLLGQVPAVGHGPVLGGLPPVRALRCIKDDRDLHRTQGVTGY
ncbi:hypothetical protein OHT52_28620 [Streptomyces sp. NBC_00247]|uniref:hypothetical protein n=1 Tax=Streptomyces sp. NBC_00247 TaxID=2975689 RepID=UPI002E2DCE3C|nr:hypothetical protein [Streptomyces sp. NBC_00247]